MCQQCQSTAHRGHVVTDLQSAALEKRQSVLEYSTGSHSTKTSPEGSADAAVEPSKGVTHAEQLASVTKDMDCLNAEGVAASTAIGNWCDKIEGVVAAFKQKCCSHVDQFVWREQDSLESKARQLSLSGQKEDTVTSLATHFSASTVNPIDMLRLAQDI